MVKINLAFLKDILISVYFIPHSFTSEVSSNHIGTKGYMIKNVYYISILCKKGKQFKYQPTENWSIYVTKSCSMLRRQLLHENKQNILMCAFMYGFLKRFDNMQIASEVIYMGRWERWRSTLVFYAVLMYWNLKKKQRYMCILLYNLKTE